MKHFSLILACATFLVAASCSESEQKDDAAVLKGLWRRGSLPEKVFLYQVDNGELTELATARIGDDSLFVFACHPSTEGRLYLVGTGPQPLNNRYAFWLKAGDALDFTLTEQSYTLNGDSNSPENREMTRWHDFVQPIEYRAEYFTKIQSTYKDFFPLLQEKLNALKDYKAAKTGNALFDSEFEQYRKINFDFLATSFLFKPRSAHASKDEYHEYYRNLNVSDMAQTTALLRYPQGMDLIDHALMTHYMADGENLPDVDAIIQQVNQLPNDTIKGAFVVKVANRYRSFEALSDVEAEYGKYLVTDRLKQDFLKLKNSRTKSEADSPAPDFRFESIDGKQVRLSSLLGKVVYIDVWATWCNPCIKEIPYLKKLEEEYSSKGIVFVSISIDAEKDRDKWKKFVADQQLKGVQLFAGDKGHKDITTAYKISGIPRFIVIGKDGKVVNPDAPRPSSSDIRKVFDGLLKK
jgi:thiol-disulfide isomerase/thioredoxin